jgi:hypothetical protein
MEYRGAEYSVVQGIERSTWVWTVRLRDGEIKTGSARSKPAAADDAERTINKASPRNDGARFRFAST